jgi:MarR family transcriptional regulator, organic hydroperoxide resistance regulator
MRRSGSTRGEPEERELRLGPALEFMRHMWVLNHALEQLSSRMLARLGVTASQRMILRCIRCLPGISPGRLARELALDAGTISAALRRLEAKGFIVRRRANDDRRRVVLELTAHGREIDEGTPGTAEEAVTALLDQVKSRDITVTQTVLLELATLLGAAAERT